MITMYYYKTQHGENPETGNNTDQLWQHVGTSKGSTVKAFGYWSEGQWFKPQDCQAGPLSKALISLFALGCSIMADPVL